MNFTTVFYKLKLLNYTNEEDYDAKNENEDDDAVIVESNNDTDGSSRRTLDENKRFVKFCDVKNVIIYFLCLFCSSLTLSQKFIFLGSSINSCNSL